MIILTAGPEVFLMKYMQNIALSNGFEFAEIIISKSDVQTVKLTVPRYKIPCYIITTGNL
jgi:hypothetical protein